MMNVMWSLLCVISPLSLLLCVSLCVQWAAAAGDWGLIRDAARAGGAVGVPRGAAGGLLILPPLECQGVPGSDRIPQAGEGEAAIHAHQERRQDRGEEGQRCQDTTTQTDGGGGC